MKPRALISRKDRELDIGSRVTKNVDLTDAEAGDLWCPDSRSPCYEAIKG